jgi:hypothetical protein
MPIISRSALNAILYSRGVQCSARVARSRTNPRRLRGERRVPASSVPPRYRPAYVFDSVVGDIRKAARERSRRRGRYEGCARAEGQQDDDLLHTELLKLLAGA